MGQQEASMYARAAREGRQNLLLEDTTLFCLSVLASPRSLGCPGISPSMQQPRL